MLYLQSTPMTEAMFAAALAALVWAMIWFADSQAWIAIVAAGIASSAASLIRYEGWFVIPFAALLFLILAKRKWHAVLFAAIAALGPLSWLAHNQYYYSNALEFYNGPWSAAAIYARQLAQGMQRYPGDHDWRTALRYYFAAARLVVGVPTIAVGAIGIIATFVQRKALPAIVILALPVIFYIWSMHSSGTPIFIPTLWPFSWYNTRYAIAVLPLAAFAAGAIVAILPARARIAAAAMVAAIPASAWILHRDQPAICWKESEVNSIARRDWTQQAAAYLQENYRPGSGIIYSFGDLTGALRESGISLRESLHSGNVAEWMLATTRPYAGLRTEWALAFSGDEVATAALRAHRYGKNYEVVKQIIVKGAPVVEIYHLQ
jgi:4-amino-4-deoxy-L-arabinose transferase-like glycosyltransferase